VLFTTATFAFLYLPIVLVGYYLLGRRSHTWAAGWLFAASVFFYGYWMPAFTMLLLGSIVANFVAGARIAASVARSRHSRAWLIAGVVFNLGLLAYFKYANFFVDNFNAALGTHWRLAEVILPIGISFYSFTQIAFLVDTWSRKVNEARKIHYGLFVTFFPHLVAGPVLHHAQMMPQFADPSVYRFDGARFWGGLTIFAIGLFKKVVLADGVAPYADAIFKPVDGGLMPSSAEAWVGALAYTFQLYFDFSGYSDMAIGLSWMFNIRLPFNFDSPYKARNISDFWRQWHITLSHFLRDYLYVPLGGNRRGKVRRYLNLSVTMVLGGLWHGASWSFVLWGTLHGTYLVLNHAFRAATDRMGWSPALDGSKVFQVAAWALTFVSVVVAWVFFRAETLSGAFRMLQAMVALEPVGIDQGVLLWNAGLHYVTALYWCLVLGVASVALPNSNQIGKRVLDLLGNHTEWRPIVGGAAFALVVGLVLLNTARDSVSAFIYFNF
jgi:alginate O-acetyltransferase complex protein AlgI